MKKLIALLSLVGLAAAVGCSPSASQLKKTIEENPDVVFGAIEKNPAKFIEVVNKAARDAQMAAREGEQKEEEQRVEEEFKNPKKAKIDENSVIFGNKNAPVTIVEYSDFECPYCSRGYETVKQVMKEYGDKVRVVFKHLPLDFHPLAMPAAKWFVAISKQSPAKAEKFHDEIFQNQRDFKAGGEKFLEKAAKKVGADVAKIKKDIETEATKAVVAADMEEAKAFGFSGTPGFLINGVSLRGAYPFPEFKKIIDRHLSSGGAAEEKK